MISPLDDRYYEKVKELEIFSEKNYFEKRVMIEIEWYNLLAEIFKFKKAKQIKIGEREFKKFKRIEKKTKHDVKAIEYFLREYLKETWAIHMLLTSEDVNNLAYALMLKEFQKNVLVEYKELIKKLSKIKGGAMPAYTHGKKATPTTFERMMVFYAYRLSEIYKELKNYRFKGKISGANGDYNSFYIIKKDFSFWKKKLSIFIKKIGLEYEEFTTQVMRGEHYSEFFSKMLILNAILIDLAEDLWLLSFKGYLEIKTNRVGSSTMPHKINPIELENAIGNLKNSNALLGVLIEELPVSKLHRDISDSTLKRNTGVIMAHSLLALKNIMSFLDKMKFNSKKAKEDMDENLLSEALQIKMRMKKEKNAYEKVKKMFMEKDRRRIINLIKKELGRIDYSGFTKEVIKDMKTRIKSNIN